MLSTRPINERNFRVLYDLVIYNCTCFGPYTQIIYEEAQQARPYTNIELAREATQLAAGLRNLQIAPGARILVMMPNRPEVLIAYQAIARAGAIIIPVTPLLKAPEVHYIAENSAACAIITSAALVPMLQGALANLPTIRYIIAAQAAGEAPRAQPDNNLQLLAYQDVVASGAAKADNYLSDLEGVTVSPDDTAVILYTSGTTGRPKGVVLTHRNLIANALNSVGGTAPHERKAEVQLAILPLAHAYGLAISNIACLSGARIIMHPRFDVHAVLSAIERHHITAFSAVPAMFVALLNTPDTEKYDTSSLQTCSSGSAPLATEVLQSFEQKFQCRIREGYGLSEAAAILTTQPRDAAPKPGSVGVPIAGVEIQIVDANGKPMAVGQTGEIIARGPSIMQSYYNLPDETANALRDGWLHTGDLGRLDEEGYLYIVERKKDIIIRGGFNIYPRDVEEVLAMHQAVIESAVIGIPSANMGEEVKAFVVTRFPVEAEALMAHCREKLANYKTPSQIEFVDSLPRNSVGKIDKKELRKRHAI
ncbi:long-chain-fatty-acid--CoA ligase [Ktedonosporobacter rubrisoli]|uniref:Long-chain-fatty-acid--CoA ligase n=1 Tax=Ktedonosporobacter rubrisoli TaxID=2509675 RepID=A0A4P6JXD7_KTERU|nr:long-chain fatty acid--CoA ligase [Ktedonosporobacter rubrisoli]QBD80417.1 long-chain-fatty-acid--CoA ligase [Ktedonosporobacter rubrisoli]